MFELFTETAIKAIMLSQEEARRFGHNFVGSEQVLLGIIREGTSVAAEVLADMGITLQAARAEAESITGRGSGSFLLKFRSRPASSAYLSNQFRKLANLGRTTFLQSICC